MRNGRPWAVRIMPAFVCVFAAFVVGYGLGEQAVFDAMNHFDELAIVERANPYRKDGR